MDKYHWSSNCCIFVGNKLVERLKMYYPILKNKTNEMLALENVKIDNFIPILELVSANKLKYDEADKIFKKIKHNNMIMVDIPNYTKNNVIKKFNLLEPHNRIEFFKRFQTEYGGPIIPILSFYYLSDMKKSLKDNIKVLHGLLDEFDNIGIRILADIIYKKDDVNILENIEIFMNDIFEKTYLILDYSKYTKQEISHVLSNFDIGKFKKIIISGEVHIDDEYSNFNDELKCTNIRNELLEEVMTLRKKYTSTAIEYSDYTVVDKINPYEDETQEGPVFYVPFLRYTTKNGYICKFSAKKVGNMEQYRDLCKLIVKHPDFSRDHCKTCSDISLLADDGDIPYKAGGTWKHRMITHHITTMASILD